MKKLFTPALLIIALIACDKQEIEPKIDKLQLLSGGVASGKEWQISNYTILSNYCTFDKRQFLTTDMLTVYPESIKDNITIILPDGKVEVDEGKILNWSDSPQRYIDKQFWTLNARQDSVTIVDYINRPSLNSAWGFNVTQDRIFLVHKEVDLAFKGSLATTTIIFSPAENSL